MIIEFFGPSGAGKTTIAKVLADNTGWEYISINSRKDKLKYVIIFLFRAPMRFLSLFIRTILEGKRSASLLRHKIHLLSEFIARSEKARIKSKNKKVILDEGLAQYGLSLYEQNISEANAYKYINRFVNKDNKIEVIVSCSEVERTDRMKNRKRIPRAHLNIDVEKWQKVISENARVFINIFMKQDALIFDLSKDDSLKIVYTIMDKI